MKHMHHIIPKHMGGTDDKDNLVELTIEEHAEAHRVLYEKYGHWQDKLAWQGLLGLLASDECRFIAMSEGAIKGSAIRNGGFKYSDGKVVKKFMPWEVPEGWERVVRPVQRKVGIGKGTKGRKWYHNPNSNEKVSLLSDESIPEGWLPGQGAKKRIKCFWYSDGETEGQFELDKGPEGWYRGRLRGGKKLRL